MRDRQTQVENKAQPHINSDTDHTARIIVFIFEHCRDL